MQMAEVGLLQSLARRKMRSGADAGAGMSNRLGLAELSLRFRDHAAGLTIQIATLLQGGVLSAAAFSLIAILQLHQDTAIRSILWLNFVIISLVSFSQLCQRSLLITRAGLAVTLMLPVLALSEIIPFAILTAGGLGPEGWRFWYLADTFAFVVGLAASWMGLRSLRRDQFETDAAVAFEAARTAFRRNCLEGVAATALTAMLTAWILSAPRNWPYATLFVSAHLALTTISGATIIWREERDTAALRATLNA
jgi:hypothetical protein